jgi:hypothetical protein
MTAHDPDADPPAGRPDEPPRRPAHSRPTSPEWDAFVAGQPEALAALHSGPPADVLPLPGGREVAVAELVQVLREQTATPRGAVPAPLRNNAEGAAFVAAAWRHTVHRQVRAVLALFDVGLDAEAQANARSALEHAVELVRLAAAADQGALEPFMAALASDSVARQRKQLKRLAEIDEATGGTNRELVEHALAAVPQVPAAAAGPKHVKDKFEAAMPAGRLFHDVYGRLSEATHAGMTSAAAYLGRMMKHGGPVPPRPDPTTWAETLAVLAWSCWAADDALGRFVEEPPASLVRHAELMSRIGLAVG